MFVCVCVWVSRLYELFTQKYSSSVQVVYSSTVYLYMNIYIFIKCYVLVCVSCLDVVFRCVVLGMMP